MDGDGTDSDSFESVKHPSGDDTVAAIELLNMTNLVGTRISDDFDIGDGIRNYLFPKKNVLVY
eukprot:CCRYP_011754-RB/>CCRYP_011754-RB protein AED:0.49 eAED:1.00 QI:0/0/0/1/0/0/2/0/62